MVLVVSGTDHAGLESAARLFPIRTGVTVPDWGEFFSSSPPASCLSAWDGYSNSLSEKRPVSTRFDRRKGRFPVTILLISTHYESGHISRSDRRWNDRCWVSQASHEATEAIGTDLAVSFWSAEWKWSERASFL